MWRNNSDTVRDLVPRYRSAREEAAILLHHDAITGTHSLLVKRDYKNRIAEISQSLKDTNSRLMRALGEDRGGEGEDKLKRVAEKVMGENGVGVKVVRVFNTQMKEVKDKIVKVNSPIGKISLILDTSLQVLSSQSHTFPTWDVYSSRPK